MSACALRLCIAQLHSSNVELDVQNRTYQVGRARISRIQVVGVLVERNESLLKLDDGSGLLDVKLLSNASKSHYKELRLGTMMECVGSIDEPWPPSNLTHIQRWMSAMHIYEVNDHNVEMLRTLELMHLYKYDYMIPHDSLPTQIDLLAFPTVDESNIDLSSASCSKQQNIATYQNITDSQVRMFGAATNLIRPSKQIIVAVPATNLPPASYQFALPERENRFIEHGLKSLEIRLNDALHSIIHINDQITINGKTSTTVIAIRKYATLQSVLEAENVSALLPEIYIDEAGTMNAAAEAERYYRHFFSAKEEEHYGLIVFHLALSSSGPQYQDEWSVLVLRHLEAKGAAGCSLADLRFAVPSLSIDQIMVILTNLQFDALVVCNKEIYRIV